MRHTNANLRWNADPLPLSSHLLELQENCRVAILINISPLDANLSLTCQICLNEVS